MSKKQKLELTWIGKDVRPKLEPRILIEDAEKSYCAPTRTSDTDIFDNRLIFGDNLLALKALEQEFTGKVKCVYIDPPFNSGNAFKEYDDRVEHSLWLSLMRMRIEIIHHLLSDNGAFFIHLDDKEIDYCRVLLDEIFGRSNFMNRITVASRSPSSFSTVNPGVFKSAEYILFYAKNRAKLQENPVRVARQPDEAYNQYIVNFESNYKEWRYISVSDAFLSSLRSDNFPKPHLYLKYYYKFIVKNANRIFRFTAISDIKAGKATVELKHRSKKNPQQIFKLERDGLDDIYILNGQQMSFYAKNIAYVDNELTPTSPLTDIWTDISWEGIASEGGVQFKKNKKPERLIKRCIELTTNPGDLVLDSFLGSGTTAAVAHKMGRRWIGIELGEHCHTHCIPRLRSVVDGTDQGGITKSVSWKGGGGFRYFKLGPSLIALDKWGRPIIDKEKFNPEALAEAVCKIEGFTYAPSENPEEYWRHGQSSETDFIYVTTQSLTLDYLAKISDDVGPNRTLAIYCSAFLGTGDEFDNLTVKKIPQTLLKKCEWGRDDYSLAVENLPLAQEEPAPPKKTTAKRGRKKANADQPTLFAVDGTDENGDA